METVPKGMPGGNCDGRGQEPKGQQDSQWAEAWEEVYFLGAWELWILTQPLE